MPADFQPVNDAVVKFGNDRAAEQKAQDDAALAAAWAELTETQGDLTEARTDLANLWLEYEAYKAAHPDEDPDPDPDPDPVVDLAAEAQGTWVLQQVSSDRELNTYEARLLEALAVPGVKGLSVRFPWDACDVTGSDNTHPLLERAKQIAVKAGKPLSIRFMAGAHTPKRIFDAGAAYYLKGNVKVPLPWSNSTGDVGVFLAEYKAYAGKLADWCKANGVRLLHLSWYGQDWAELNHGKELREAEGYTQDRFIAGSKALVDVAPNVLGDGLAVELPLSGYGPLSGGQSASIADHIISKLDAHPNEFFVQANGLGPNGEWGAPSQQVEADFDRIWAKAIARGVQMIQPQDYTWADVFAHAREAKATYVEIYLPSFTLAHAAQLRTEIAAFNKES